jgi:peroxiredoxin
MRWLFFAAALSISACHRTPPRDPSITAADPMLDDALVGTTPGEWTTEHWRNSAPLTLEALRGRVVVVRWFMSTECPYCTATAPALRAIHEEYASKGVVVVGLYHHRGPGRFDVDRYDAYVRRYAFTFPVAVDVNWTTLERWWLRGHRRDFTSVTFVLDRRGRVRAIHPGGSLAKGTPSYDALRRALDTLVSE